MYMGHDSSIHTCLRDSESNPNHYMPCIWDTTPLFTHAFVTLNLTLTLTLSLTLTRTLTLSLTLTLTLTPTLTLTLSLTLDADPNPDADTYADADPESDLCHGGLPQLPGVYMHGGSCICMR